MFVKSVTRQSNLRILKSFQRNQKIRNNVLKLTNAVALWYGDGETVSP